MPERTIEVGRVATLLRVEDPELQEAIDQRYASYFTNQPQSKPLDLTVRVTRNGAVEGDNLPHIEWQGGRWRFDRADFQAEWRPDSGRGWITQEGAFPYPLDSVLRILHSLVAAPNGGCFMHASSAVHNGHAVAFTGVSGSGKTTMARLAPHGVNILTDDISCFWPVDGVYRAFGTPFVGDYGKSGENMSAPLESVYLLKQGPENNLELLSRKESLNVLLRNILLFTRFPKPSEALFETAFKMADCVRVYRLTFAPTPAVWDLIV